MPDVAGESRRLFGYAARGVPYGPDDGTIAGWAALASLPFTPDVALDAVRHMHLRYPETLPESRYASSFNPGLASVDHRAWVSPGTHVTSVGYAAPHGELDRELAEAANLFVESRVAAFSPPPAGCMELAGMDPEKASEMGEVLLGKRPGRGSDDEITVYKSMGHAVEDLAASGLVYREAKARGAGSSVEL